MKDVFDLMFGSVAREPENGVLMKNTVIFIREGKGLGLTTHVLGDVYSSWQVCSPIRTIEESDCGEYLYCRTRSGNLYKVEVKSIQEPSEFTEKQVQAQLGGWFGQDTLKTCLNLKDIQEGYWVSFEGEPIETEKKFYN